MHVEVCLRHVARDSRVLTHPFRHSDQGISQKILDQIDIPTYFRGVGFARGMDTPKAKIGITSHKTRLVLPI